MTKRRTPSSGFEAPGAEAGCRSDTGAAEGREVAATVDVLSGPPALGSASAGTVPPDVRRPWGGALMGLVLLTRPKQWLKNGFVLAAAIFGGRLTDPDIVLKVGLGFVAFCALSGAVYTLNDLRDRESDQAHPTKRRRPVASGVVPVGLAWLLASLLTAGGLGLVGWAGKEALVPSLAYVLLNVAYSLWAKDLVILDVLVVSAGFLLRVVAGGSLAGVHLSPWLLACTFLLSLTLALGKRRGELTSLEAGAAVHRRVMSDYSARFLDQMIAVVGSVTITCYILYTLLSESGQANPYLFVSVLPVVYGLLRYFYLVYHHGGGEAPEALPVNDRPLLAAIVLWLAAVGVALYI